MKDLAVFFLFGVNIAFIVLMNYLYFGKVLRTLDESPKMMPSGQFDDMDRYLQILKEREEYYWFVPLLRRQRMIATIYVAVFAVILVGVIAFGIADRSS